MATQKLIALEVHDATLWEPMRILPLIDRMQSWGYNALVLHQNDLLDVCTQIDLTANYGVSDLRLKKVRNAAAWLNRLTARLDQFNARLFLEIKEPSFHDYALELVPNLLGADGQPDPMRPAWAGFCEAKVQDLLARVPGLGGLIVNLSSPESRVSMPDHVATTAQDADMGQWFDRMIAAFSVPLLNTGKSLYVRDFSYTADVQSDVLDAIARCKGRVQASVKITAHDYFPRSRENPAIKRVGAEAILEVDAFGEHTGWGVIPNCRVAEFARRLADCRQGGNRGLLVRTSWEAISGGNALDSLSAANVYALPRLVAQDIPAQDLMQDWVQHAHGVSGELAEQTADLLLQSWRIPAAAYWDDMVFPRHSCLPSTWAEGWMSMETIGMGRRERALALSRDDARLSEEKRVTLFAEKEAATALATRLAQQAEALRADLPHALAHLFESFEALPVFARQFELAIKATFYAARALPKDLAALPPLRAELLALAQTLTTHLEQRPDLPHHAHVLLDPDQIRRFVASLPEG